MRWATFRTTTGTPPLTGLLRNQTLHALPPAETLIDVIADGDDGQAAAAERALTQPFGRFALEDVTLLAPVPRPPSVPPRSRWAGRRSGTCPSCRRFRGRRRCGTSWRSRTTTSYRWPRSACPPTRSPPDTRSSPPPPPPRSRDRSTTSASPREA